MPKLEKEEKNKNFSDVSVSDIVSRLASCDTTVEEFFSDLDSDIIFDSTDVDFHNINDTLKDLPRSSALASRIIYLGGKAYREFSDGRLVSVGGRPLGSGKYGASTVSRRIPEYLVSFVDAILEKCREIELCRRNISSNFLNTSPEAVLGKGVFSRGSRSDRKLTCEDGDDR